MVGLGVVWAGRIRSPKACCSTGVDWLLTSITVSLLVPLLRRSVRSWPRRAASSAWRQGNQATSSYSGARGPPKDGSALAPRTWGVAGCQGQAVADDRARIRGDQGHPSTRCCAVGCATTATDRRRRRHVGAAARPRSGEARSEERPASPRWSGDGRLAPLDPASALAQAVRQRTVAKCAPVGSVASPRSRLLPSERSFRSERRDASPSWGRWSLCAQRAAAQPYTARSA